MHESKRDILQAHVLKVVADTTDRGDRTFSLDIIKAPGLPSGDIYPILATLEREGYVLHHYPEAEERRRSYTITDEGRTLLHTYEALGYYQ